MGLLCSIPLCRSRTFVGRTTDDERDGPGVWFVNNAVGDDDTNKGAAGAVLVANPASDDGVNLGRADSTCNGFLVDRVVRKETRKEGGGGGGTSPPSLPPPTPPGSESPLQIEKFLLKRNIVNGRSSIDEDCQSNDSNKDTRAEGNILSNDAIDNGCVSNEFKVTIEQNNKTVKNDNNKMILWDDANQIETQCSVTYINRFKAVANNKKIGFTTCESL